MTKEWHVDNRRVGDRWRSLDGLIIEVTDLSSSSFQGVVIENNTGHTYPHSCDWTVRSIPERWTYLGNFGKSEKAKDFWQRIK